MDFVIYDNDTPLGSGSYGKVCKAKWGQLPCAVKVLHDKYFSFIDNCIVANFEQECEFLSTIKHPNIVQCLGTAIDPQSQWPALFMELMDESLTRFLERSTGPLPYHSQLNICYDVALALSYLHSNGIIHRDLSSNNVMLTGEGSRAKVTDFGMSRLVDMFPKQPMLAGMASLGTVPPHVQLMTQYPGTLVYMPPEACGGNYSTKLDCFSFGVLTIQILTKKIPNPAPKRVLFQKCEVDRRTNDIVLVNQFHPIRPIALACLKDVDTERPSADELCEKLASLKGELEYTLRVQETQGELQETRGELQETQGELQETRGELQETQGELQETRGELQETQGELQDTRGELQETQGELQETRGELQDTRGELQETRGELQETRGELQETRGELQETRGELQETMEELQETREELQETQGELQRRMADLDRAKQLLMSYGIV